MKTALSMSGWGCLTEALWLWGGQAPSLVWGDVLVLAGKLFGHEPADLANRLNQLEHHDNITAIDRSITWKTSPSVRCPCFFPTTMRTVSSNQTRP